MSTYGNPPSPSWIIHQSINYSTPSTLRAAVVDKGPQMPESMKDLNPTDILAAAQAIKNSRINYPVAAIESVLEADLKDWEVKQLEVAMRKFLEKHNSPLAKALK